MDFVIELVLEILLEGMIAGASSRKVPLGLRILLGAVLLAFFGGIAALLFILAFCTKSILVFLIALFVLFLFIVAAIKKVREFRK